MCSLAMEVRAAGLIVFRRVEAEIQYLLLQSSRKTTNWLPPKGHVDPGETDLQAAFRETLEEAGIKENQLRVVNGFESVLKYTVNNRPKRVVYWAAELMEPDAPVTLSDEHSGYTWERLAAACKFAAFPDMVASLQECDTFLKEHLK